jgi:AcrR family transcriptional regulator
MVKFGYHAAEMAEHGGGAGDDTLPVTGQPRPERADAARNRRRILAATRALVAERGVGAVTTAEVARTAGVAKGTVFHRFGDRAGLIRALLDEQERDLQERILRGPAPLGPGAPAAERLHAFLDALLTFTDGHRDLLLAVDGARPAGRYRSGAYGAWHRHATLLLRELRHPTDAGLLAHVLLAPLAADLVLHLRVDEGRSLADRRRPAGAMRPAHPR